MAKSPQYHLLRRAFTAALKPCDEVLTLSRGRLDRRKFLEISAVVAAGVITPGFLPACASMRRRENQPRIAIIGAGIAGLNVAWQLKKRGYAADVYEAAPRVGGRILTIRNAFAPGLVTEMGGEYIDSEHADVLKLVQEMRLDLLDTLKGDDADLAPAVFIDGRLIRDEDIVEAIRPMIALITKDIESIRARDNGRALAAFDALPMDRYFDRLGIHGWLRGLLDATYVSEFGLDCSDQSTLNFLKFFTANEDAEWFGLLGESDERYKIAGGNDQLPNRMMERLNGQVHLEHRLVRAADRQGGGYRLTLETSGGGTKEVDADIAVFTLPFATLRQVELGELALPAERRKAIQELGYGTCTKVVLGMRERFWRKHKQSGYLFTDRGMQTGWDASRGQKGTAGMFTVFSGGREGSALGRGPVTDLIPGILKTISGPWPEAAGQYTGKHLRMDWEKAPFALGSYSCFKPGQHAPFAGKIGDPIGRLFFAGEHCSDLYQGYIQGAAETGRIAADGILKLI